jgi:hypothetical protein
MERPVPDGAGWDFNVGEQDMRMPDDAVIICKFYRLLRKVSNHPCKIIAGLL